MNPTDTDSSSTEGQPEDLPRQAGEPFYTDAGRVVYAAGGITPDVIVRNNFDSKLETQLLARSMFFNFAVDWVSKHPETKEDFTVTPEIRAAFFRFVEAAKFSSAVELQRQWSEDANRSLIDLTIRIEVANAKFGLEAGRRDQVSGDSQVQKALTLFDEAARIAALPKKTNQARAAKS